jgi:UDP-N-acetylglucosamine--N-acetylmuramyl-(pentapeptide) pyrophosphoryl-undecaprenol N-acetylglucosamine transferase
MQVLHLTGHAGWEPVVSFRQQLPQADRYHALPYLHEMGQALASADLVVSRAGASTLAEYPLFGLPAILVPYPYAWRYQKVNAAHLVDHRAAVLVRDEDLGSQLLPTIRQLVDNPEMLAEMRTAMQTLAVPGAADAIAGQIRRLAYGKPARRQ